MRQDEIEISNNRFTCYAFAVLDGCRRRYPQCPWAYYLRQDRRIRDPFAIFLEFRKVDGYAVSIDFYPIAENFHDFAFGFAR